MSAIRVEGLRKSFGELRAVDGVSFDVGKGEIFGFLGPNGAGKTTTTRLITGVLSPDEGDAYVNGISVLTDRRGVQERIGIVPEVSNPYMEMTAWQNLMLTGGLYGMRRKEKEARAKELLDHFGLADRSDDLVKKYSKGMKRKLVLAMAMVHDPDILFLDEPTSGLDVLSQRMIREKIRELNSKGTTVFISTHNMVEANELCDRIAIIAHGRIAATDTPEELKRTIVRTRSVKVSFEKGIEISDLDTMEAVELVRAEGNAFRIFTAEPVRVVEGMVDLSRSRDTRIATLELEDASLEEVYLRLTGGQK